MSLKRNKTSQKMYFYLLNLINRIFEVVEPIRRLELYTSKDIRKLVLILNSWYCVVAIPLSKILLQFCQLFWQRDYEGRKWKLISVDTQIKCKGNTTTTSQKGTKNISLWKRYFLRVFICFAKSTNNVYWWVN